MKKVIPGATLAGIPLGERGGLILDAAALKSDNDAPFAVLDIAARVPIKPRLFFDARLPVGAGVMGNTTVGVHYIGSPSDALWVSAGGSFGFPLASGTGGKLQLARAAWDAHEWLPQYVPFKIDLGLELHNGSFGFRAEVEPVLMVSIEDRDEPQLYLQHAFELQMGHELGAGLRVQGVVLATFEGDMAYQAAIEPFFAVERDVIFARVGLVLPVSEGLGPPFEESWGLKFATGFRLN